MSQNKLKKHICWQQHYLCHQDCKTKSVALEIAANRLVWESGIDSFGVSLFKV